MRLADRVALITGATSGIGSATARLFAQEGAKIALTGRNEARGREGLGQFPAALFRQIPLFPVNPTGTHLGPRNGLPGKCQQGPFDSDSCLQGRSGC